MIFNTLLAEGGVTGTPIEVTELPTPTEKDVGKIYLLKKEEKEFIYPEVGQAIGDKIYFDTSVNPLDYVGDLGNIIVAVNGEEYYALALADILAMQNIEGYGHAYVLGMTDSTMSVLLGLPYIYCDTLTVEQFNSMIGSQFGVSIPSFGWLTDVIDTSTIADWTIDENNVSSYGNIAYTDFEIKQSEEYYKVNKVEGTPIEVGKPVPNILHYDMSVTPDFSNCPADGTPLIHFISNEQYISGVSMVAPEAATNNQGTIEMVSLMLMQDMPIFLYVGGTASLETINAMFGEGMGTTFTQKGWQGNGTVNITGEAIKLGTAVGAPMEQIESILAAGLADPVTTFNDPQGIFIAEDQYVFETLGGSGFPIEVEELPTPTEDDVGKVYLKTTTNEYYEVVGYQPITIGTRLGTTIKCDTSKTPTMSPPGDPARSLVAATLDDDSGITIIEWAGLYIIAIKYVSGGAQVQTVYVPDVGTPMADINNSLAEIGAQQITEWGWQTDTITTGSGAGMVVETLLDEQGLFLVEEVQAVLCNNNVISPLIEENETLTAENTELEGQVSALEAENTELEEQVSTLQGQIEPLNNEIKNFITDRSGKYTVPDGVQRIGEFAFAGWNEDGEIIISNKVSVIGDHAFYRAGINKIAVPEGVGHISIGRYAFAESNLRGGVVLPERSLTIMPHAFEYCFLEKITIPGGVRIIQDYCFANCNRLQEVIIADSISSIGHSAFRSSENLHKINLPTALTNIYDYAFAECSGLHSVILPSNLEKISTNAFYMCCKLVEVVNNSPHITITKGSPTNGHVGYYALAVYNSGDTYESKLSEDNDFVIYTDGEEKILVDHAAPRPEDSGDWTRIIPDYVTQLREYALAYIWSPEKLVIPDKVKLIGSNCFFAGASVTRYVIVKAVTPPTVSETTLSEFEEDETYFVCQFYVPLASIEAYKAATGWSSKAAYIRPYVETVEELSQIDTTVYTSAAVGDAIYNYADGAWTAE